MAKRVRIQSFVKQETADKIKKQAKQTDLSESKVAGYLLDKYFSDDVKNKVFDDLVCGGFSVTKTTDKGVEYIDPLSPEFQRILDEAFKSK